MEFEFGKFKGRSISDPKIPTGYLQWLWDKLSDNAIDLKDEIERRKQLERDDRTVVEEIIEAGYNLLFEKIDGDAKPDVAKAWELRGARKILSEVVREYFWKHKPDLESNGTRKWEEDLAEAKKIMRNKHASKESREWAEKILAVDE